MKVIFYWVCLKLHLILVGQPYLILLALLKSTPKGKALTLNDQFGKIFYIIIYHIKLYPLLKYSHYHIKLSLLIKPNNMKLSLLIKPNPISLQTSNNNIKLIRIIRLINKEKIIVDFLLALQFLRLMKFSKRLKISIVLDYHPSQKSICKISSKFKLSMINHNSVFLIKLFWKYSSWISQFLIVIDMLTIFCL